MPRNPLLTVIPMLLLCAGAAHAGWPYASTAEDSTVVHEDTRLNDLQPYGLQSSFFPAFGDNAKVTTIVQLNPIDPKELGGKKAKGKAMNQYSCVSTQTSGSKNLGTRKDKFDPLGNAATTIRVNANQNCDYFRNLTGFKGGREQPAGSSANVIANVQRLPDDADPACYDLDTLCLRDGRFRVNINWSDFGGVGGEAVPIARSNETGLFYFFDPHNWEMLIKVLDGCGENNHFWVFAGAVTDVEYTLTVVDTATNQTRNYFNPLGNPAPAITDTTAFATCP